MFKIEKALISVSNKKNIEYLAQKLHKNKIEILSSGGTAQYLKKYEINTTEVSDYTNHPEILDGRVKTLHPKIHGGILARQNIEQDSRDLVNHSISKINLIIVNLYPFQEQLNKLSSSNIDSKILQDKLIEYIDIGGPTLIRAAAKNYQDNIILVDPQDYSWLQEKLDKANNNTVDISLEDRLRLAAKAFKTTAEYENSIYTTFEYCAEKHNSKKNNNFILPETLKLELRQQKILRYGENPDQQAALYRFNTPHSKENTLASPNLLQGKELSYNNLVDSNSAIEIINSLNQESDLEKLTSCVIIKHATPCGVASCETATEAYLKAFEADPKSAFGGIVAVNASIDATLADNIITRQFIEVIIAADFSAESLEIFKNKPNIRLIKYNFSSDISLDNGLIYKNIDGGILAQTKMISDNLNLAENFKIVTIHRNLDQNLIRDLKFSWHVVQNVKSNAIVLVKDLQTLGIGGGQTSRVGSVELALKLAREHRHDVTNSVLASDAFFPFADSIELAAKHGIKAIIQPGGSKQDEIVISKACELGITMIFTNKRKFLH